MIKAIKLLKLLWVNNSSHKGEFVTRSLLGVDLSGLGSSKANGLGVKFEVDSDCK